MDDNLMKKIIESNSKVNSMAKAILVRWKWDDNNIFRIFLGLRYGGTTETQFDLDQKYPASSEEKVTLLLHADQLANLNREEKISKIVNLLDDGLWKWDPSKKIEFIKVVNRFLGAGK
ncbi:MAG: hypothetical protein PHV53_09290 [Fermentimonas sp.]|nr:hypothetical protein [Fermentimonas sp.]